MLSRETVITKKHCPRLVAGLKTLHPPACRSVCVCVYIGECVYVSVEYLFGIERSRICVGSVARPRHWKTTGSPELDFKKRITFAECLRDVELNQSTIAGEPTSVGHQSYDSCVQRRVERTVDYDAR